MTISWLVSFLLARLGGGFFVGSRIFRIFGFGFIAGLLRFFSSVAGELIAQSALHHVEPAFWLVVVFTSQDVGSVADGVFQLDVHTWVASKLLGHVEWLCQEALDAARPSNDLLLVV